jgi:hypothetical protein
MGKRAAVNPPPLPRQAPIRRRQIRYLYGTFHRHHREQRRPVGGYEIRRDVLGPSLDLRRSSSATQAHAWSQNNRLDLRNKVLSPFLDFCCLGWRAGSHRSFFGDWKRVDTRCTSSYCLDGDNASRISESEGQVSAGMVCLACLSRLGFRGRRNSCLGDRVISAVRLVSRIR